LDFSRRLTNPLPLKWRNVDFERGMITVIASKTPLACEP